MCGLQIRCENSIFQAQSAGPAELVERGRLKIDRDAILDNLQPSLSKLDFSVGRFGHHEAFTGHQRLHLNHQEKTYLRGFSVCVRTYRLQNESRRDG